MVSVSLPFFTFADDTADGATAATSSSSAISSISESFRGLSLSSVIVTVIEFVLISEIVSVIVDVADVVIDTRTTRATTPIMIPSIVRNDLSLFEKTELKAIFIEDFTIRPPPRSHSDPVPLSRDRRGSLWILWLPLRPLHHE